MQCDAMRCECSFFGTFAPIVGFGPAWVLYFTTRVLESHWFTWVTSMSHLPMKIDEDQQHDWVTSQLASTQNVHGGAFNDWFTGHLNYQIEHHLFPRMPRHNYSKVKPMVIELCKKHGIHYEEKSLLGAFGTVLRALREGASWEEMMLHAD